MFLSKKAAVLDEPTLRPVLNCFERYPPVHVLLSAHANIQSFELKVLASTQTESDF